MVFLVVMYRCESWTIKKAESQIIDAFKLWCWRRLLRVPWRKSTLNIHWKSWCWSSNTMASWFKELTHSKRPWYWERLKAGREGDDRGWDGWMASPRNRHEFGQTPGDREGQGSLVCCSPWGHKELVTTEWLNNNNNRWGLEKFIHIKWPSNNKIGLKSGSASSGYEICKYLETIKGKSKTFKPL